MPKTETYILTFQCPDRHGLVADVASLIAIQGGNITDAQQYNDPLTERFFMRVEFTATSSEFAALQASFSARAEKDEMSWTLRRQTDRQKVLILVSKFDHCLVDLLYRWRRGELEMDVVGIASNHPKQSLDGALIDDLPFFHLPITKETKPQQEQQLKDLIAETGADLIVLARYMQILSDDLAAHLSGRCINIHHSFLPGFKGARPYHQAHRRGVKMIGATGHYVTADLDEGPIIHQDVEAVSHSDSPEDLVRKGRDIERRVLAAAVRHHLQGRVFLNGDRTVVFSG